jgi:hypothetical protein
MGHLGVMGVMDMMGVIALQDLEVKPASVAREASKAH